MTKRLGLLAILRFAQKVVGFGRLSRTKTYYERRRDTEPRAVEVV
jgi:hypothetical protein